MLECKKTTLIYFATMRGDRTQIKMHFNTSIELRQSRLNGILYSTSSKNTTDIRSHLIKMAKKVDFGYLSLYSADGTYDTLYGR